MRPGSERNPRDFDPYAVLEVSSKASEDEIRRAYRHACFRFHPDTGGTGADAERLAQVQRAYSILGTVEGRERHDRRSRDRVSDTRRAAEPPILSVENIRANVRFLADVGEGLKRATRSIWRSFRD